MTHGPQVRIPATYMRGGTSKGVFFRLQDLPEAAQVPGAARDALLMRVIGSPDPYGKHTAGMGGTTQANTGPGYGFGLGFAVRLSQGMCWVPGSPGESLWSGVWGTSFWLDFKENLTALILTQGPTHKIQSRMLYKTLVYSALVK